MAIDPSIALQAKPSTEFDFAGSAKKGMELALLMRQPEIINQQLASQRATEQATLANTALTKIQIEEAQRMADASRRLAEIAKSHVTKDPTTGKPVLNKASLLHDALAQGVPFESVTGLAKDVATIEQGNLDTEKAKIDYANNRLYELDHLIRVQKDPAAAQKLLTSAANQLAQVVGPEQAAQLMQSRYGDDPTQFAARAGLNALGTISPAQAEQFKISQEQLRQGWTNLSQTQQQIIQAGAANLTSPEALNINSALSEQYRKLAIAAGIPESQVKGLNAAQIHRIPGIADVIQGNVVPAQVRAGAVQGALASEQTAQFWDKLKSVADKAAGKFPQLTPIQIAEGLYNKVLDNDPVFNEYRALLEEAKTRGITLTETAGPRTLSQVASNQAALARQQGRTAQGLATKPTFRQVPDTVQVMQIGTGAIRTVPKSLWDNLTAEQKKAYKLVK